MATTKSPKQKSARQVRFLLSKGSPLSGKQQTKLKSELHSGKVTVKKGSGSNYKKRVATAAQKVMS